MHSFESMMSRGFDLHAYYKTGLFFGPTHLKERHDDYLDKNLVECYGISLPNISNYYDVPITMEVARNNLVTLLNLCEKCLDKTKMVQIARNPMESIGV